MKRRPASVELERYFVVRPALAGLSDGMGAYDQLVDSRVERPYNSANVSPLSQDEIALFLERHGLLEDSRSNTGT